MSKISAVEKGVINKQRYADYVAELERNGRKFPINQFGDVNLTEIAKSCGFNRQVFTTNASMKKALADDVRRVGTEITEAQRPEAFLANKVKVKSDQINKLMRDLAIAEEKIHALESQVINLERENKLLKTESKEAADSLDYMLSTGRRFAL